MDLPWKPKPLVVAGSAGAAKYHPVHCRWGQQAQRAAMSTAGAVRAEEMAWTLAALSLRPASHTSSAAGSAAVKTTEEGDSKALAEVALVRAPAAPPKQFRFAPFVLQFKQAPTKI